MNVVTGPWKLEKKKEEKGNMQTYKQLNIHMHAQAA